MSEAGIISIVIALVAGALITLLLTISKIISVDSFFEVKVRRLNLMDESSYRLEVLVSSKARDVHNLRGLTLLLRRERRLLDFAYLTTEPFLSQSSEGDEITSHDGVSTLTIAPSSECVAIYCFQRKEGISMEEGDELYLAYEDRKGRRHFARFEDDSYVYQLLQFRRRGWK